MGEKNFSVAGRVKSFRHALAGFGLMLKSQHNAWIHLAATLLVCLMGVLLKVTLADWRWLLVAIMLVWVAEALNTAFEHLCDVVSPDFHEAVQKSKDIAASAVLICAIGALCIGFTVFWPYLRPPLADAHP